METKLCRALENHTVKGGLFDFAILNSCLRKREVKVEKPFTGTFPTKICYAC